MKTQSRLSPILPAALRVGAVALAGHALLTASAQGQERSAPQRNLELRNPPLVREMAPRFGRAGEAARRIEQSPQGQSRGGGLFHHREAREAGQALRELHGTQRVNPLERTPSAASGTDRAVPGQGLPAPEQSRLGKSEVAGMPSLGLPDNRKKRPSGWVGGPTDLRGPARGIVGNEDEDSTIPPPPPGTPADQNRRTPEQTQDAASGRGAVSHTRPTEFQSVYVHTDDEGTPTATVVETDEPEGGVSGTVYRYTPNGVRVITYLRSAQGRTTVTDSRGADSTDRALHDGAVNPSVDRSHTQDTYAGAGSGVNPLTGRSTQQPRRNPDQVNPDRSGVAQPQVGARLRVGDDIVTNPDPHQQGRTGAHDPLGLQRLLREGQGPGGIPEPPATGPESGAQ